MNNLQKRQQAFPARPGVPPTVNLTEQVQQVLVYRTPEMTDEQAKTIQDFVAELMG